MHLDISSTTGLDECQTDGAGSNKSQTRYIVKGEAQKDHMQSGNFSCGGE